MSSSKSVRRSHRGVLSELDQALELAREDASCRRICPAGSGWSVQQHLEHLLLTDAAIAEGLENGLASPEPAGKQVPSVRGGGPTAIGHLILWTGRIPRGRAQAPDFVEPQGMERELIVAGLVATRARLEALGARLEELRRLDATIAHPMLGEFTAARWLRFAHVHHRHHRRIIDDILASEPE